MTFKEWSDEYNISAEILTARIHTLKEELPTAPAEMISSINRRIEIMYQMYLDCRKTAEILALKKEDC